MDRSKAVLGASLETRQDRVLTYLTVCGWHGMVGQVIDKLLEGGVTEELKCSMRF